jgi:3-methyladenine DNA glycosylase/8-oxoguanine DNA glycosylase
MRMPHAEADYEAVVPLPADFDFAWSMRFLAAREVPSIEATAAREYRRVVRFPGAAPVALFLRHEGASLRAHSFPQLPRDRLVALVTRLFDLDVDLDAFRSVALADPVLGPVVGANPPGLRLPQLLDPFECLVRAILGQQVSVTAATTLTDRLVRLIAAPGPPAPGAPELAFPTPAAVAEAGADRLRSVGLTRARAATIHGAAAAIASGALDLAALAGEPAQEAERALCALPGVGPWTAGYVRMRSLGARDAFPAADLGVIRALERRGIARADVARVAERWRPWRAYATLHLWYDHG